MHQCVRNKTSISRDCLSKLGVFSRFNLALVSAESLGKEYQQVVKTAQRLSKGKNQILLILSPDI